MAGRSAPGRHARRSSLPFGVMGNSSTPRTSMAPCTRAASLGQAAQRRHRRASRRVGDDIGDQPLIAGSELAGHDHGLPDGGMAEQDSLDLLRLDAETAQLDLQVDAAEVFEVASSRQRTRSPVR